MTAQIGTLLLPSELECSSQTRLRAALKFKDKQQGEEIGYHAF